MRTVVLVGEHNEEGALGVVLNRRSETAVEEAVPDLADLVEAEDQVHVGGPVQPSAVLVLAEFGSPAAGQTMVVDDVGFLAVDDEDDHIRTSCAARASSPDTPVGGPASSRTSSSARTGSSSRPAATTCSWTRSETLWSSVLDRKGGAYRLVARMPLDPSVN